MVLGFLLAMTGCILKLKADGTVSLVEGVAILVGYVMIVTVIALIVEIVRKANG